MNVILRLSVALPVVMMSQVALAAQDQVVRSDRIAFQTQTAAVIETPERVKRTDRIEFNLPIMEQPSLKSKRIVRSDRIVFNKI